MNNSDNEIKPLSKGQYIAFFAMVIGMFMAILDIQIVASSLSVIAAGLSASGDEMSWVQTSYIIAEVIIIPMTGFLARAFSTRIAFFTATLGFTVMSVMCSMAWSINSMIIFRALQGFFGGAMIPTVFATIFMIFSTEKRSKMGILLGLVVTVAPTLGPTIGGYVTDVASWRMMFLMNVLPGIFVCTSVFLYGDFDKPNLTLLKNFDYLGVFLMILGLGTLEYILEEGVSYGWLESRVIVVLCFVCVVSLISFLYREYIFINPVIHLSAFKYSNFRIGCMFAFVLGIGLYGAVYLMPLYLYRIAGMDTLQIGIVMIVTGASQFLSAPLAGFLNSKGVDYRKMLFIGMVGFSLGCYTNSFLTPDWGFWEFFLPQVLRGASLMFCFIPINEIVFNDMPKSEIQNASGIYNLMRNLGGAIGLAVISTILINNTKKYSGYLAENMPITDARIYSYTSYISDMFSARVPDADLFSLVFVNGLLQRDGNILAINNIFVTISFMFIAMLLLLPLVAKRRPFDKAAAGAGH